MNDCFVFGNPAINQRQMEDNIGGWWTAPDLKVAFWRPLAAVTHALDLSLWPANAVLMHLHSLLWFVGLLYVLYFLYRRFLSAPVAALALALYAWDDARGMVLSWVSNRSILIGGLFGISCLIAHDKWRRDGWRRGAWLAPGLLVLALLSAEMAVGTAGFLLGYALWVPRIGESIVVPAAL